MNGQASLPIDKCLVRGKIIDLFARMEDQLTPKLERIVSMGLCKKAPYQFGDKFRIVCDNVHAKGVWQHPRHVEPILKDLQPYAKARGILAHGVFSQQGGTLTIRKSGCRGSDLLTLDSSTVAELIDEMEKLIVRLERQPIGQLKSKAAA